MRDSSFKPALRQQLAAEAARIIAEQGVHDYGRAREKARARLGRVPARHLPDNQEIERALQEYQRLFQRDDQPRILERLRRTAVEAMERLHRFQPKLVGPVLWGTAGAASRIHLHLFADAAEDIALFLIDRHIPYDQSELLHQVGRKTQRIPVYLIGAGDTDIALQVFSRSGPRQAPPSRRDGKPEQRASLAEVRRLVEAPPTTEESVQSPRWSTGT